MSRFSPALMRLALATAMACSLGTIVSAETAPKTIVEPPKNAAPASDNLVAELDVWMNFLQAQGYKAIDKSDSERLLIESSAEGVRFNVQFFGCDGIKDCLSVQFWAAFDLDKGLDIQRVNDWNRDKRYAKAYLDSELDPFLEMDINMTGGLPESTAAENLALWTSLLADFKTHIDW